MYKLLLATLFLLVLTTANAQTDTTPPAGQRDSIVPQLTHADSVRRDSLARIRRARRDSLRQVKLAAQRDSLAAAQKDSATAAAKNDSIARTHTTPSPAPPPPPAPAPVAIREGPPALSFWQKVLAMSPDFNFTGKPVVEIFEVHRANAKDSLFYLLVGILFYFALVRIFFEKYFSNLMTL